MGKRGPAAAPTPLKIVRGDRKARTNKREPKPSNPDRAPACPSWLSPAAKRVWRSVAADMHRRGVLMTWDRETFAVWCVAVVTHREATVIVDKTALLVKGAQGNMVKNPALQIQRDAALIIRGFAQEFGLTPSARSGIEMPEGDEFDAARRLLS